MDSLLDRWWEQELHEEGWETEQVSAEGYVEPQ